MGIFLIVTALRERCDSTGLSTPPGVAEITETLVHILLNLIDYAVWRQLFLLNGMGKC